MGSKPGLAIRDIPRMGKWYTVRILDGLLLQFDRFPFIMECAQEALIIIGTGRTKSKSGRCQAGRDMGFQACQQRGYPPEEISWAENQRVSLILRAVA